MNCMRSVNIANMRLFFSISFVHAILLALFFVVEKSEK